MRGATLQFMNSKACAISSVSDGSIRYFSPIYFMLIAVNTRMLLKDKMEGIGYFSSETLKRMVVQHPEHTFLFLFDRPFHRDFIFSENIIPVVAFPPARHPLLWYWWFEFSVPKVLKRYKPDVFLSPDGYLSLRDKTPALPVIHDINFRHYPADLPFIFSKYYNHFFPLFVNKAQRIATVSEFSKEDIARNFGIASDKIDVVYNGVNDHFRPLNDQEKLKTRMQISNGNPYFLFVSSLHKRKNIVNQLKAFDLFKQSNECSLQFVFAGGRRWWSSEMEETLQAMKYKDDVIFTGRVSEANLYSYTASAFAMIYVSSFEGFGIPIIEAMKCRVPVITSNVTSMPEVAGNAALLCDPFSEVSIANAMTRLWHDKTLEQNLMNAGEKRAKDFSWDRTAALLWESVLKTTI